MIKDAPVILLEFNELTPALVERFTRAGQLPNFDRFYRESRVFITDAEETQDKLNPWIQWVTVHSGLSFAEHGVFHLGDGHKLMRERLAGKRWKRAVLLDQLQWDVFRYYYRKLRPAFATFFLNSTAHLQHKYWRHMEPEHFTIVPSPAEQAEYESAILFGYQQMDKLLGEFIALAGRSTTLILCTALSQQPCLTYEDQGGK